MPPVCLSCQVQKRKKIAKHAVAPTLKRKRKVKKEVPEPTAKK
jgi:hypothetical protein